MTPKDILDKAASLLQGEPARAIGYGAAIVIVGVIAVANQLGYTQLGSNIDLPTALGMATAAILTIGGVIETIRKFVTPVASLPAGDADLT